MFYLIIVKITFMLLLFSSIIMPFSKNLSKLYFNIFGDTFVGNVAIIFSDDKELEMVSKEKGWLTIALIIFWFIMIFVSLVGAFLWPLLLIYLLIYKFVL